MFGLVVLLGARCYTIRGSSRVCFGVFRLLDRSGQRVSRPLLTFCVTFDFNDRALVCVSVCVFFRTNRNNAILQRKLALPVIASVRRIVNVERLCELTSRTAGRNWDFGGFCVRAVIV